VCLGCGPQKIPSVRSPGVVSAEAARPPNIADLLKSGASDFHLVPERERRDQRYDEMVAAVLSRSFAPDVRARMLCLPSFEPEWVAGLRRTGGPGGRILAFVERAKDSIWHVRHFELERASKIKTTDASGRELSLAELHPEGPPGLERIITGYSEQEVDSDTADLVERVWSVALGEMRIPSPGEGNLGLDGVSYYFWKAGAPAKVGRSWSPRKGSRMAELVNLGGSLAAVADSLGTSKEQHLQNVRQLATAFLNERARGDTDTPPNHALQAQYLGRSAPSITRR
jgi:hypothetical protein